MNRALLIGSAALGLGALLIVRRAQASSAQAPAAGNVFAELADQARAAWAGIVSATNSGSWAPPAAAQAYLPAIYAAEDENGIPRNLYARQLDVESDHFAPDVVSGARRSSAGAIGIAQLMPATAAELRVDPREPFAAIAAGGRYMAYLYRELGSWEAALAGYNWGIGNVKRRGLEAAPAETKDYVQRIAGVILA